MKETDLKSKSEVFREMEKHKYLIVRDHEKRILYRIIRYIITAIGLLATFLLSVNDKGDIAATVAIISFAIAGFFYFLESFCPICNHVTPYTKVEGRDFEVERLFCNKCNLTDKQMSKYVDLLKRNVELNEENVRRIFLEK